MIHVALLCAGMLVGQVVDSTRSQAELKTYQGLEAKAGREPGAHVKLALWCEAHGLNAERLKHLTKAVLFDPRNAAARGLLGLVESGRRWEAPEQASERINAESARAAALAEYHQLRARLTGDEIRSQQAYDRLERNGKYQAAYSARLKANRQIAQAHVQLAHWCEHKGLESEATAHFLVAVRFDPYRDSTWKSLGYVKRGGRWISRDQSVTQDEEERDQKQADREWEPILKKWLSRLSNKRGHEDAENFLASVTDRRAIPSVLKVLPADGPEAGQLLRVQLLGQIVDRSSSRALAAQATWSRFDSVRRQAIEILKGRHPRDYAAELVDLIRGAVRYEIKPVSGPGSRGALAIDAPKFRMLRTYEVPPAFQLDRSFRGYVGLDDNGLPIVVSGRELDNIRTLSGIPGSVETTIRELEIRTVTMVEQANDTARGQMAADISVIETANQRASDDNARIIPVLTSAAGAPGNLGDDENAWHAWWFDTLGYSFEAAPKPTFTEEVTAEYFPPSIRTCFGAGTPVSTLNGPRPIEAIEAGDRVLSQDAATGALSFQPVVFVHRNPPAKTLRLTLVGGDSVVSSIYHRFWRANLGWAQARELRPGDTLRHLGGTVQVDRIEPESVQPLYNLDVATCGTFFVGQSKLLVHDNTLPDYRLVPFDALPLQTSAPQ